MGHGCAGAGMAFQRSVGDWRPGGWAHGRPPTRYFTRAVRGVSCSPRRRLGMGSFGNPSPASNSLYTRLVFLASTNAGGSPHHRPRAYDRASCLFLQQNPDRFVRPWRAQPRQVSRIGCVSSLYGGRCRCSTDPDTISATALVGDRERTASTEKAGGEDYLPYISHSTHSAGEACRHR
jgi:hypothetical protein